MKRQWMVVFAGAFAATAAVADDGFGRCFEAAQVDPMVAVLPGLQIKADDVARLRVDAGDDATVIYLLTRQIVLLERMHRRLLGTDRYRCEIDLDALRRDFAILKRGNAAFIEGNADLGISRIDDSASVSVLREIDAELSSLEKAIASLVAAPLD